MIPMPRFGLSGPIDQVLHIGAGTGGPLDQWRELGARTITLVEADPSHGITLHRQASGNVRVILRAVAAEPSRTEFLSTSFRHLSSLRQPTGILHLYPGLQVSAKRPVDPLDPVDLCIELAPDPDAHNVLMLDAPGENLSILARLRAEDWLCRFRSVLVCEGRDELYQQGGTLTDCTGILQAEGYDLHGRPGRDPAIPWVEAVYDREKQRRIAVEKQLVACEENRQEDAAQKETLETRLISTEADLNDLQEKYAALSAEKEDQDALLSAVANALATMSGPDDQVDMPDEGSGPGPAEFLKKRRPG